MRAQEFITEATQQDFLWHGSREPIKVLEPRQSVDTGGAAGNNQGDANRHARQWIERTGYSGAYEIVPEMR